MGESMLNQERVREMTRLAIFDQKEGRVCRPVIQYFRKDYIAKEMIKSFLTGTASFGLLAGMIGLYWIEDIMEQLNVTDLRQTAMRLAICYAAYMGVYFFITYLVYHIRYTRGRHKVKKYYMHLKKVNRIYREEEQM